MSRAIVADDGIFGIEQVHPINGDVVRSPYEVQYLGTAILVILELFLMVVALRSTNPKYWDWFRLTAVYIVFTIPVALAYPFGTTRLLLMAIISHNAGEWILLFRLWTGKRFEAYSIFHIFVIFLIAFLAIRFIPLKLAFVGFAFHGAGLDFMLPISFVILRKWILFVASMFHATTVILLFFGLYSGIPEAAGTVAPGVLLAFLFYMIYAFQEEKSFVFLGPSRKHKEDDKNIESGVQMQDLEIQDEGSLKQNLADMYYEKGLLKMQKWKTFLCWFFAFGLSGAINGAFYVFF